jgi:beta-N-acetylhexosaminidase
VALLVLAAAAAAIWFFLVRDESESGAGDRGPGLGVSPAVAKLVEGLSDEELVDQVLLLGFDGTDRSAPILAELGERQLGGVMLASANWAGADQGAELTKAIRAAGAAGDRIPPLLVAAQEGGRYRAFTDLPPVQTELEVADQGSVPAVEEWARATAAGLADAGFDLNLFPVADVATLDSPVADRAFSDDPVYAAQLTAASVRGCRAAGLACAPLHFPGLGAASEDTSAGPATVSLDEASLSARDLEPFRAAVAERAPAIVLSLAFYAAYDSVTPGALTEPVATGLLRERLRFEGVAITDDLGSGAVHALYSVDEAAVEALRAGADLLQIGSPDDQGGVRDAILAALESGRLSHDRLAAAAGRVIELKRALDLVEVP